MVDDMKKNESSAPPRSSIILWLNANAMWLGFVSAIAVGIAIGTFILNLPKTDVDDDDVDTQMIPSINITPANKDITSANDVATSGSSIDVEQNTSGICGHMTTPAGDIFLPCEGSIVFPEGSTNPRSDCIDIGATGPCLSTKLFKQLARAAYAFNVQSEMDVLESQTIALVIDTTGTTNFSDELEALPGTQVTGETPISLIMEAEIVGPAFKIIPAGRQQRKLSRLNPVRWDWDISPKRSGKHQLEMSLYVVATNKGVSVGEDKALAERQVINVTVAQHKRVLEFVNTMDPILAFLVTLFGSFAVILAWFGIKSWRDMTGVKHGEDNPQKIEVTIKEAPNKREDGE